MRIAVVAPSNSSYDINVPGNIQGDEAIARAWVKYLSRRDGTEAVLTVVGDGPRDGFDIAIHFSIFGSPWPGTKNVMYCQNAFPPETWPDGTVGQYRHVAGNYDALIYTSETLRKNCGIDLPSAVIPFAVDEEIFCERPVCTKYAHPVAFVGNNIRSALISDRYIKPAILYGLVIYGNMCGWGDPYYGTCRGKIHQFPDEVDLYSSADVCLNCHINEHVVHDTINYRIYCILACGGFVVSDRIPSLVNEFSDAVVFTDGGADLCNILNKYIGKRDATKSFRDAGRDLVLSKHTFKHRIDDLVGFLRGI